MAASAQVDAGFLVALLSRRVAVSQATQPDHVRGSRDFYGSESRRDQLERYLSEWDWLAVEAGGQARIVRQICRRSGRMRSWVAAIARDRAPDAIVS